jgi:hypothetical protein
VAGIEAGPGGKGVAACAVCQIRSGQAIFPLKVVDDLPESADLMEKLVAVGE